MERIIKKLEGYSPDLTIGEVISKMKQDQENSEIELANHISNIKNKFRNTYLKSFGNDGLFGEELILFYIDRITKHEKSCQWENIFTVKGEKFTFSNGTLFRRVLSGQKSQDSFNESILLGMEIITKDEYDFFLKKYEKINKEINDIVNGKTQFKVEV